MFVQGTRLVDFTVVQERFTKMLPVGSRTVSYTHLDVYKRQVSKRNLEKTLY